MQKKRSIKQDYLLGEEALRPFYQYPLQSPDFARIISDKSQENIDREALHRVIEKQYEGLEMSEATRRNLDLLREENTFTLTTGHQLVLFGGPLFTIYKVLSAIRLAEGLQQEHPAYNFVPLFWIHTEDHDYNEINHYYAGFGEKKTYPSPFEGAVGKHMLTEAIRELLPAHLEQRFSRWYAPGVSMTEAFRGLMNEIFGEYGLVILDPDHPDLKARFSEVIAAELNENRSQKLVTITSGQLQEAGYDTQINPREINLFYLDRHGRNRIISQNGHFQVLNTDLRFSPAEMTALAQDCPECFSPNVSLRPLYQEAILPNLAYIGGWGELSYWLQLRGVFEHFQINFPLLLPRMMATVFTQNQWEQWEKLGFSPADIHKPMHELFRAYMPQVWDSAPFQGLRSDLLGKFTELETYIKQYSDTLPRSVIGQRVQAEKFFVNLEKKLHKVIRQKNTKPFEQIERLKQAIQPEGAVQERTLSLAALAPMQPDEFIRQIWPHADVLNPEHRYIPLTNL